MSKTAKKRTKSQRIAALKRSIRKFGDHDGKKEKLLKSLEK